ncbi:hypothetical protein Ae406Ps2_3551 [Pseudonocardia sp. Ae406_Ps2]|nr:hypothetical protein Ae406Ps2_3551 [Pseudonocardia sp. Ae406_Ps2]OLM11565.1 hypothetical protein Ae505Ps2_1690c [Pseudonocardia sp. Ae505_Ps2]OLM25108.1 hypothetical protein Ae706Ps2_3541 [Pseudonocardia sp. Ae706_Ps2]
MVDHGLRRVNNFMIDRPVPAPHHRHPAATQL